MWEMTWEHLIEEKWIVVGSPETVIESLEELTDEFGAGRLVFSCELGTMPKWMALKNMEIISEQVIPHFRGPDGKPVWAREERAAPQTRTELVAQHGRPPVPRVRMDAAGYIDPRLGHIPETLEEARIAEGNGRPAEAEAPTPAS
jgi:hypothetical protein